MVAPPLLCSVLLDLPLRASVPCPQDAGRLALAALALAVLSRADADGQELHLIPLAAVSDLALPPISVRASPKGYWLRVEDDG